MTNADKFHAHLDACERCRTKPFNLCATGARLLDSIGREAESVLGPLPEEYGRATKRAGAR